LARACRLHAYRHATEAFTGDRQAVDLVDRLIEDQARTRPATVSSWLPWSAKHCGTVDDA
jgi:hypothetical protein